MRNKLQATCDKAKELSRSLGHYHYIRINLIMIKTTNNLGVTEVTERNGDILLTILTISGYTGSVRIPTLAVT